MPIDNTSADEPESITLFKKTLKNFDTPEGRAAGVAMTPRRGDVFITTPPKCGTTLLQQAAHQLRIARRDDGSVRLDEDFVEISRVVPWIELAHDLQQRLEDEQVTTPRHFKTHLWAGHAPSECNPTADGERAVAKVVLCIRHPYDAVTSFYRFLVGWMAPTSAVTLDDFARHFFLGRGKPTSPSQNSSYFHFVASWIPIALADPSRVRMFAFERLTTDRDTHLRRLAAHLDIPLDDDLLSAVSTATSFAYMKEHESLFNENLSKELRNPAMGLPADAGSSISKVRRGAIGDGSASLSPEIRAAIDQAWTDVVLPATGAATYEELVAKMYKEQWGQED